MQGGPFHWHGHNLWISRSGYTGEDGFEISVPAIAAADAGRRDLSPMSWPSRSASARAIRCGSKPGCRSTATTSTIKTTPVMAGLNFAINKRRRAEGGFAGAMRILAELQNGPPQKRVGFEIEGRQPVREGALVLDGEGNEVGQDHQRRLLALAAAPDRHGLCRDAISPRSGPRSSSSSAASCSTRASPPMPFVPHRYHRKGAA